MHRKKLTLRFLARYFLRFKLRSVYNSSSESQLLPFTDCEFELIYLNDHYYYISIIDHLLIMEIVFWTNTFFIITFIIIMLLKYKVLFIFTVSMYKESQFILQNWKTQIFFSFLWIKEDGVNCIFVVLKGMLLNKIVIYLKINSY